MAQNIDYAMNFPKVEILAISEAEDEEWKAVECVVQYIKILERTGYTVLTRHARPCL